MAVHLQRGPRPDQDQVKWVRGPLPPPQGLLPTSAFAIEGETAHTHWTGITDTG